VVADEVRQLSKNTQDSLNKTGETISSVTKSTGSISQSIESIEQFMSRLTNNTAELTAQIQSLGDASNMASRDVSENIRAIQDMTARMSEIDKEVKVIESLKQANNL
jgi:methyl-accepting chemotaxis protein